MDTGGDKPRPYPPRGDGLVGAGFTPARAADPVQATTILTQGESPEILNPKPWQKNSRPHYSIRTIPTDSALFGSFGHSNFGLVSNFEIRISCLTVELFQISTIDGRFSLAS